MTTEKNTSNMFEHVLINALKVPGVKVNRKEFLSQSFAEYVNTEQLGTVLDKGPIEAGISLNLVNKLAKTIIQKRTLQSTGVSFAAGLPGGLTMAATIPADTLQFFGVALRMAQELAYLFGHDDLWNNDHLNIEKVQAELTLYLGVMFGVGGTSAVLKVVSAKLSQQVLKKLPQKALMKTVYYPIIKKTAAILGVNLTKRTFAQGVSKFIPVIGGIVSGGLTYASMKPMGDRLRETLYEALDNYTDDDFDRDLEEAKNEIIDIESELLEEEEVAVSNQQAATYSVADEILKFKQLLDMGAITQEEYDSKKAELLKL